MKIFAIFFSVGIFAALALPLAQAAPSNVLPFKRSCVQIISKGFSKNRVTEKIPSRPFASEDLAMADDLLGFGLISRSQRDHMVNNLQTGVVDQLFLDGAISPESYENLVDTFSGIPPAKQKGPAAEFEVTLKVDNKPFRSRVLVQVRQASLVDTRDRANSKIQAIVLLDPKSLLPFAALEYEVRKNNIVIEWIRVNKRNRGFGYAELLFLFLKSAYPDADTFVSEINGINRPIFEYALSQRMAPLEAVKYTPLYKVQARVGFRKISLTQKKDGAYVMQASRAR